MAGDYLLVEQIQNQCEIPAATSEQAAYLLDAALASRSCSGTRNTHEQRRHSHMVFSLNLYEEKANQNGRNAGKKSDKVRIVQTSTDPSWSAASSS